VTAAGLDDLRSRLYESYVSQHAGIGSDEAAALVYRRDIRPLLSPPSVGAIIDLGCGRGHIVTKNLTFAARKAAVAGNPVDS
jgi:hypothetical protein